MARVGWLILLVASSAVAQSLTFVSLPGAQNMGAVGGPFTIRRLNSSGQPTTNGTLMVTVSSNASTVEFSNGSDPQGTWASTLTVTIANGQSQTGTTYLRANSADTTNGYVIRATATGFTQASDTVFFAPAIVTDDAESGSVFLTDNPPGEWNDSWLPITGNSLSSTRMADHRGQRGLRLSDNDGTSGAGGQNAAYFTTGSIRGNVFFRSWFRLGQNNGQGRYTIAQLTRTGSMKPTLIEVEIRGADRQITVNGFDDTGALQTSNSTVAVTQGQWHLIEMNAIGAGTATGQREVFLDGQSVVVMGGVAWAQYPFRRAAVGEPYSNDQRFTGDLDFDDIRVTVNEPPSRFDFAGPSTLATGVCTPVEVFLKSSRNILRLAPPYDLSIALAGTGAQIFADPQCNTPATSTALNTDASSATVYVSAPSPGSVTLNASFIDFLPGQFAATATGDGGVIDSGIRLDGGTGILSDGGLAPPTFTTLPDSSLMCGEAFTYTPQVVSLSPVTYSLQVDGDAGVGEWSVNPQTGVVQRMSAKTAPFTHQVRLIATNTAGATVQTFEVNEACVRATLQVGCSCHGVPSMAWPALLAGVWLLRRRRS